MRVSYRLDIAFDAITRIEFEQKVLFPLAGLDPSEAEQYYKIRELIKELECAWNEVARQYLDGRMNKDEAIKWFTRYRLSTSEEADQYVRFIEKYRSYVVNYDVGQRMVRDHIEKHAGTENHPNRRWEVFYTLLSTPQTPSGLAKVGR